MKTGGDRKSWRGRGDKEEDGRVKNERGGVEEIMRREENRRRGNGKERDKKMKIRRREG